METQQTGYPAPALQQKTREDEEQQRLLICTPCNAALAHFMGTVEMVVDVDVAMSMSVSELDSHEGAKLFSRQPSRSDHVVARCVCACVCVS